MYQLVYEIGLRNISRRECWAYGEQAMRKHPSCTSLVTNIAA